METRELRYFVAVAEELHFGRAATRLGIAQPPLSRAIQQLERRLEVPLFLRAHRSVTLTEAGSVLLREARIALDAVDAAEQRTRRAGRDDADGRLVLVTKTGASSELLAKLVDAYAADDRAAPLEVVLCQAGEQERMLRDGRADVALLHLPFDDVEGLEVEPLETHRQVAVLPAGHPLSTRESLAIAEVRVLTDAPLRFPTYDGGAAGPEHAVRDVTQLLQLVGLGRASAVLPESVEGLLSATHAAVPVSDVPEVTTVIAWPEHATSPALALLVRTATRL